MVDCRSSTYHQLAREFFAEPQVVADRPEHGKAVAAALIAAWTRIVCFDLQPLELVQLGLDALQQLVQIGLLLLSHLRSGRQVASLAAMRHAECLCARAPIGARAQLQTQLSVSLRQL